MCSTGGRGSPSASVVEAVIVSRTVVRNLRSLSSTPLKRLHLRVLLLRVPIHETVGIIPESALSFFVLKAEALSPLLYEVVFEFPNEVVPRLVCPRNDRNTVSSLVTSRTGRILRERTVGMNGKVMSSFPTQTSHQLATTKSIVYIAITLSVIQPATKRKNMAEGTATPGS